MPPHHYKNRIRIFSDDLCSGIDQQVNALVGFKRSGVKNLRPPLDPIFLYDVRNGFGPRIENRAVVHHVFNHHLVFTGKHALDIFGQCRTDRDDGIGVFQGIVLQFLKHLHQQPGPGKFEIMKLLRQRGMHVIQMPRMKESRQPAGKETGLFVGMNHVIPVFQQQLKYFQQNKTVEKYF